MYIFLFFVGEGENWSRETTFPSALGFTVCFGVVCSGLHLVCDPSVTCMCEQNLRLQHSAPRRHHKMDEGTENEAIIELLWNSVLQTAALNNSA